MSSEQRLRVGHVPGVTLRKWRTVWAERFPAIPLDVSQVSESDQRAVLDEGAVELCFVRLPVDTTGLHLIPLYEERAVAWASRDHPIQSVTEVTTDDLAGEVIHHDVTPLTLGEVAFGDAILWVPLSVARTHSRRDMIHRPIIDAPPTRVGLAWRQDATHPWIDEFIGVVRGRSATSSRSVQERARAQRPEPRPRRLRGTATNGRGAPSGRGRRRR